MKSILYPAISLAMYRLWKCLLCSSIALFGFEFRSVPGDWPQFGGPSRNGISQESIRTNWNQLPPKIAFSKPLGSGFSGPVVLGDRLFIFHRQGDREELLCLDAGSGNQRWTSSHSTTYRDDFRFDEGPRSTPAVAGERVVTLGADGLLTTWNAENGNQLWQIDFKNSFSANKGFFGFACSPLIHSNRVYVQIGAPAAGVVCADLETGKIIWKTSNHGGSYSSPVLFGDKLACFTREGLSILSLNTGQEVVQKTWRAKSNSSVNAATPLVHGDLIFISASYETGAALLEFQQQKLKTLWSSDEILSNHYNTGVIYNNLLFGIHGRQEEGPDLRCVELKTGKVKTSIPKFGAASLIMATNCLLALSEAGEIFLFPQTSEKFSPRGQLQILGRETRAAPALSKGRFYARDKTKLICLELNASADR